MVPRLHFIAAALAMVCGVAVPATAAPIPTAPLVAAKLPPPAKARLGMQLYRKEMLNPTPRPEEPYTDPRTHDFVLADITRKLVSGGAEEKYPRGVWQRAKPGEVKDCLTCFLALKGDVERKAEVQALAEDVKRPLRLRELAVEALGKVAVKSQDGSLGAMLSKLVREDTAAQYVGAKPGGPAVKVVFPVRRAALAALKALVKAGVPMESYVTAAVERAVIEQPVPKADGGVPAPPPG